MSALEILARAMGHDGVTPAFLAVMAASPGSFTRRAVMAGIDGSIGIVAKREWLALRDLPFVG